MGFPARAREMPGLRRSGGGGTGFSSRGSGTTGLADDGLTDDGLADDAARKLEDDMGCTSAVGGLDERDNLCLDDASS